MSKHKNLPYRKIRAINDPVVVKFIQNIFKKLCKIEDIKCIFFFQPTVYN